MYVKPAPDRERPGQQLKVRIPGTLALLPDAGAEVPENRFWMRRLAHGDVVVAAAPAAQETPNVVAE